MIWWQTILRYTRPSPKSTRITFSLPRRAEVSSRSRFAAALVTAATKSIRMPYHPLWTFKPSLETWFMGSQAIINQGRQMSHFSIQVVALQINRNLWNLKGDTNSNSNIYRQPLRRNLVRYLLAHQIKAWRIPLKFYLSDESKWTNRFSQLMEQKNSQ